MVQPPPEESPRQPLYGGQPPPSDTPLPRYGQPYGHQPSYERPPPGYAPQPYAGAYYPAPPKQSNGFAIAGIILAFFAPIVGLIFSIIGLTKSEARAGAGKALSITGIAVSATVMVGSIAVLAAVQGAPSSQRSAGDQASSSPAATAAGPLGLLPVPAGATAFSQNTNAPLSLDAFVQRWYEKSAWKEEESLLNGRGFSIGAFELWTNPGGSEEQIAIARFASSLGAQSEFKALTTTLRAQPAPARAITDAAVGGIGWVNPTQDSYGFTRVEIAVLDGNEVIDVTELTALSPDIAAAEALILKQCNSLKAAA